MKQAADAERMALQNSVEQQVYCVTTSRPVVFMTACSIKFVSSSLCVCGQLLLEELERGVRLHDTERERLVRHAAEVLLMI